MKATEFLVYVMDITWYKKVLILPEINASRQAMSKTPGGGGGEGIRIETKEVVRNASN